MSLVEIDVLIDLLPMLICQLDHFLVLLFEVFQVKFLEDFVVPIYCFSIHIINTRPLFRMKAQLVKQSVRFTLTPDWLVLLVLVL